MGSLSRFDVPAHDGWGARLGSFRDYAEAEDRAAQFSSSTINARILNSNDVVQLDPGYWVVYAGPFDTKSEAKRVASVGNDQGGQGAFARYASVDLSGE